MNLTKLQELAAAHALGALDLADQALLEAALGAHRVVRTEVSAFRDIAASLASALSTPLAPTPALRARLLQRISELQPPEQSASPEPTASTSENLLAGFRFVMNDGTGWSPGPVEGLRTKQLSINPDMGYRVVLAELAPGGRLPEHDHSGSEELMVLSGHLQTEGRLLGPGDFLHAESGTHHHELVSPDGCVALLIDRAPQPLPR